MSALNPRVGNLVKLRGESLDPLYGYGIIVSVSIQRGDSGSTDFGFITTVDVLWQSGELYKSIDFSHLVVISGSAPNS